MRTADRGTPASCDGRRLRVAIVQARFNASVTDALAAGCIAELQALGVDLDRIRHVSVPGALEIGIALDALASSEEYDALVALGCIIRGETYHFEIVANQSAAAIARVALDHGLPIANGVLTVENESQAWERVENGREAGRVAVEMANLLEALA